MGRKRLGIVGIRGMVGQTLTKRMLEEGDFHNFETTFYSEGLKGQMPPEKLPQDAPVESVGNLKSLKGQDIILTCQGSAFTQETLKSLRHESWKGVWIDAASELRQESSSCLVLDPVNEQSIKDSLHQGTLNFVGANCTVSLLLLALKGLIDTGEVQWASTMSYQAASGAGARHIKELIAQMGHFAAATGDSQGTELISRAHASVNSPNFPQENFKGPLAGGLIPWIDTPVGNGQTREEWKAMAESSKILGAQKSFPIDGTCVRIGSLRSHAQAVTLKLKRDISLESIEESLKSSHEWLRFIENTENATKAHLGPIQVAETLDIAVGRVRKTHLGPKYLNIFTVGDQLLWGAAEPLRRMLKYLA